MSHSERSDEFAGWIAEERVGEIVLGLEGGVGFGAVGGKAEDF